MRYLSGLLAIGTLIVSTATVAHADDRLEIEFDTAVAKIAPRSSASPIKLPNLTFTLRARTFCPGPETAESLSVSIADTRITISPADEDVIEESIQVSEKQLGPVAVEDFCLGEDTSDGQESLRINDALTAQLSLRCAGESSESISYESAALSVALLCEVPEPQ
ncbi:MAG: hypothetical protein ACR2QL_02320 [Woeseiaceae bacterium]